LLATAEPVFVVIRDPDKRARLAELYGKGIHRSPPEVRPRLVGRWVTGAQLPVGFVARRVSDRRPGPRLPPRHPLRPRASLARRHGGRGRPSVVSLAGAAREAQSATFAL